MGVSLDETAKRVRESRERVGLTLEDAASQSGMTPATWRQWEAGSGKREAIAPIFPKGCGLPECWVSIQPGWSLARSRVHSQTVQRPVASSAGRVNAIGKV